MSDQDGLRRDYIPIAKTYGFSQVEGVCNHCKHPIKYHLADAEAPYGIGPCFFCGADRCPAGTLEVVDNARPFRMRIWNALKDMSADEANLVALVAERVAAGRKQYGELVINKDPRRMLNEAGLELVDATAYLAMEALRRGAK